MKINIKNGVENVVDALRRDSGVDKQWYELRNKVDVILLSNNAFKSAGDRLDLRKLDDMSHEERQEFILNKWGPMYLDRCMPVLIQLNVLERSK